MSPRKLWPKKLGIVTSTVLASAVLLPALPAFGSDAACEEVYQACQAQLERHARCAQEESGDMVSDAAAIFELQHRLEISGSTAAFGADPASKAHLERLLDGLRNTADASLSQPGQAESVLIGDLHFRHAERLGLILEAPRTCDAASLRKLERSCKAGVGEARALTQSGWPAHVATCIGKKRSASAVVAP